MITLKKREKDYLKSKDVWKFEIEETEMGLSPHDGVKSITVKKTAKEGVKDYPSKFLKFLKNKNKVCNKKGIIKNFLMGLGIKS